MTVHRVSKLPACVWFKLLLAVAIATPGKAVNLIFHFLRGRQVRAANLLRAAAAVHPDAYSIWIRTVEAQQTRALPIGAVANANFTVILVLDGTATQDSVLRTIASIEMQLVPAREIIVVRGNRSADLPAEVARSVRIIAPCDKQPELSGGRALSLAVAAAAGDFVIPLAPGLVLARTAIARFAEAVQRYPQASVLYADEDIVDALGRRSGAWFKPIWNPDLFLAQDYVSRASAISTRAAASLPTWPGQSSNAAVFALLLGISRLPGFHAEHIPHVLCHHRDRLPVVPAHERCDVLRHSAIRAECAPGRHDLVTVRWPLPDPAPSISIIIPTRDGVDLLKACVGTLLSQTVYPSYEVIIVDNGSVEASTHEWLRTIAEHPLVSVCGYPGAYNFSAINNFAVARAVGQYVCLLNNDTEIIEGGWLEAMVRQAARPQVGAVGAKLLYADRSIQHAGVVLGLGNAAGHAHRFLPDQDEGYFALAHATHAASAVTAACLLVERRKYLEVGGLDEDELQIAYNDVDFCLKLKRAGYRNIYEPAAVLLHHESKSRGNDLSPENRERYLRELSVLQSRWGTTTVVDPVHHPHLDRTSESFRLGF